MEKKKSDVFKKLAFIHFFVHLQPNNYFIKRVTSHKGKEKTGIWIDGLNKDFAVYLPKWLKTGTIAGLRYDWK